MNTTLTTNQGHPCNELIFFKPFLKPSATKSHQEFVSRICPRLNKQPVKNISTPLIPSGEMPSGKAVELNRNSTNFENASSSVVEDSSNKTFSYSLVRTASNSRSVDSSSCEVEDLNASDSSVENKPISITDVLPSSSFAEKASVKSSIEAMSSTASSIDQIPISSGSIENGLNSIAGKTGSSSSTAGITQVIITRDVGVHIYCILWH